MSATNLAESYVIIGGSTTRHNGTKRASGFMDLRKPIIFGNISRGGIQFAVCRNINSVIISQ